MLDTIALRDAQTLWDARVGSARLLAAIIRAQGGAPPPLAFVPRPTGAEADVKSIVIPEGPICINKIQASVASYYNIPVIDMVSQRRGREIARPRQIAMYLCRMLTPLSLPVIGRQFGKRDHTTVMWAIKAVERLIDTDPQIEADIEAISEALAG
jgi:hypothetical protein